MTQINMMNTDNSRRIQSRPGLATPAETFEDLIVTTPGTLYPLACHLIQ